MKTFDRNNPVSNLPDVFAKAGSNNEKILEIEKAALDALNKDISALEDMLDIDKVTGKTLDLYGDMVHQPRGQATDEQYRLMIKSKIMQNFTSGDYKSVHNALCQTFNCDPSEVFLKEVEGSPAVELVSLPVDVINRAGLTISQTTDLVKQLLPSGVKLVQYSFDGTFELANDYGVYDVEKGLADAYEGATMGGYLGTIGSYTEETILQV